MTKNLIKLTSGLIVSMALATAVYAATSIRLEQPKSPTNQNTFDINFVTLDTQNSAIVVKCQKKGPSDGGFVQFGSDINVNPNGGNTGNCAVDSGVLGANGTYQFQATANSATSNIVTVDFNNSSGPDTPTNYSKEQLSSCVWRIKFKTANDSGKTVKVEVYRSDQTSFNADSGTRVATVSIGSNTDGQADVTSPDCNKTYYFAVRAFDTFGNGSGVVGDSVTITVNPTTTASSSPSSAGGAIPVSGGGARAILGEKSQVSGEVEATSTASSSPKAQPTASPAPKNQTPGLFSIKNITIGVGVLAALALIYYFLLRKKPPVSL